MSQDDVDLKNALESALGEAGEDPSMAGVYAVLLARGHLDVAGLAEGLRLPVTRVSTLTDRLIWLGLVRRDHTDEQQLIALPLDGPLSRLLATQEAEAAVSIERLSRLRVTSSEAGRLLRQLNSLGDQQPESQTLDSGSAVVSFLHEMNTQCTSEVLTLIDHNPSISALRQSREQDLALLDKGVRVRSIYLSSAHSQPELMAYLRWLGEHGAGVALAPMVPVRMMVFDRRTALVARDPEDLSAGALVLRSPGLVTAMTWLFELCWQEAEPIESPDIPQDGLSAVELDLLRHFARGRKDAAIARQMNVSVRTVRRTVTQLNERFDVTSRFELGAKASEMGWITTASRPPTHEAAD